MNKKAQIYFECSTLLMNAELQLSFAQKCMEATSESIKDVDDEMTKIYCESIYQAITSLQVRIRDLRNQLGKKAEF